MNDPGWYPDPAGEPDAVRFWDGQQWGDVTTSYPPALGDVGPVDEPDPVLSDPTAPVTYRPYEVAPAPAPPAPAAPSAAPSAPIPTPAPPAPAAANPPRASAPPPPPAPGPPPPPFGGPHPPVPGAPFPPARPAKGPRTGLIVAIVVAVLLVLGGGVATAVVLIARDDSGSSSTGGDADAGEGTDETSEEGEPATVSATPVEPNDALCRSGSPELGSTADPLDSGATGGGLRTTVPSGYTSLPTLGSMFTFVDGVTVMAEVSDPSTISIFLLGGLRRERGFTDPGTAAQEVMACLTKGGMYGSSGTLIVREQKSAEAITVAGRPAVRVTSRFTSEALDVADLVTVVVVDTGDDDSFGVLTANVAEDDQTGLDKVENTIDGLALVE